MSSRTCWVSLFLLHAITAKEWHSTTGSRMQRVLALLDVLVHGHVLFRHTHSAFTAPSDAKVSDVQFGRRVDPCHSPRPEPAVRKVADPLSQIQLEANLGSIHK